MTEIYPLTACHYYVLFDQKKFSFSKISEVHIKSAELTTINEGGRNKPYIVHDTKKAFHTITFEKGYGTFSDIENISSISGLSIVIQDSKDKRSFQAVYWTNRAVLQELVLSELNAGSSELLIQKMTFAYNTLKKLKQ